MRKKNNELYNNVLLEIKKNSMVTEVFIANKYLVTERTIRRYIKELKDSNKIYMIKNGKRKQWKIIDDDYKE